MELLAALQQNSALPFHMPGHKRNSALLGGGLPYALDITETKGFDNLQQPQGALLDIMERAAALWGSDKAYISVNGSTGAILAGIRAMTRPGDTVLVARNCHMSVYHAAELCGLRPVFLEPEWLPGWGIYGRVTQRTVDAACAAHPQAALCVITSPTYEGVVSDVTTGNIPLLVDAAHGAHLLLPRADLVVHSLHKTLPALTQTAMLHVRGGRVDRRRLEAQLRVFQTSSPSYVLLASVGECVALLERHREEWFARWRRRLDAFYAHAGQWRSLVLFDPDDKGKLLVRCDAAQAAGFLRLRGIEPEYAQQNRLLLMTSPCDTEGMMAALGGALGALDNAQCTMHNAQLFERPPEIVNCQLSTVNCQLTESVRAEEAIGRVSAEYVWQYPPGIPLFVPGQRIDRAAHGREWVEVVK